MARGRPCRAWPGDQPSSRMSSTATPGTRTWRLLMREAYGIPLVLTVHSLEPLRPWKREQLGGGYDLSHLGRADRHSSGRRGHRGLARDPRRLLRVFAVARAGPRDPQRHRHRLYRQPIPATDALKRTASTRRSRSCCSWADHAAEGHRPPGARHPADRPGVAGGAVRRRARHARDRRGNESGGGEAQAERPR